MDKVVRVLGSLVIAIIAIAMPMLCALSFGFDWNDKLKFLLFLISLCEFFTVWIVFYECSEG